MDNPRLNYPFWLLMFGNLGEDRNAVSKPPADSLWPRECKEAGVSRLGPVWVVVLGYLPPSGGGTSCEATPLFVGYCQAPQALRTPRFCC